MSLLLLCEKTDGTKSGLSQSMDGDPEKKNEISYAYCLFSPFLTYLLIYELSHNEHQ
jgi:hypothetical protein